MGSHFEDVPQFTSNFQTLALSLILQAIPSRNPGCERKLGSMHTNHAFRILLGWRSDPSRPGSSCSGLQQHCRNLQMQDDDPTSSRGQKFFIKKPVGLERWLDLRVFAELAWEKALWREEWSPVTSLSQWCHHETSPCNGKSEGGNKNSEWRPHRPKAAESPQPPFYSQHGHQMHLVNMLVSHLSQVYRASWSINLYCVIYMNALRF